MKTEIINGVNFNVITGKKAAADIQRNYDFFISRYGRRGLYDAYKTPSDAKISIWQEWSNFADEIGGRAVVMGAGSHTFSIGIKTDNKIFYITKGYNKVVNL